MTPLSSSSRRAGLHAERIDSGWAAPSCAPIRKHCCVPKADKNVASATKRSPRPAGAIATRGLLRKSVEQYPFLVDFGCGLSCARRAATNNANHGAWRLGLAEEVDPVRWRLDDELEATLRRTGERGDIIKTMHRELTGKGLARSAADYLVHDRREEPSPPVVGRLVARGLADEINDRHYLIVDGVDGKSHWIDIGKGELTEPTPDGCIVRVTSRDTKPRQVDRTIADIATAHGGRYSVDMHLKHDAFATESFAETHIRRLEAIRRSTGGVEREPNGTWIIAPDHLDRVAEYERLRARVEPVIVEKLSSMPLERQVSFEGATWLDRNLVAERPEPLRNSGFGHEVREAHARRRQWLIAQGLAHEEQDRVVYRANMISILRQRDLNRVAGQLSDQLGLSYAEAQPGERIEGTLRRSVELASGKYAVIEKSREFTLVPWRPVLDRYIGKEVSGVARGEAISWTLGRQRSGHSVS